MDWQTLQTIDDSDVRPVERLSFDILRALLANRQASSPTVRALSGQTNAVALVDPAAARVRLLAGHALPQSAAEAAGTFFSHRGRDQAVALENGDHPVAGQGERHA